MVEHWLLIPLAGIFCGIVFIVAVAVLIFKHQEMKHNMRLREMEHERRMKELDVELARARGGQPPAGSS